MNNLASELDKLVNPDKAELRGRLGISRSVVKVTNRPGFVWVRMLDNPNELIKAQNDKVSPTYDMPVKLIYDGRKYVITGRDSDTYVSWGTDSAFLPNHGGQHSAIRGHEGKDITWVDSQQFLPLLVMPTNITGSSSVVVSSYFYRNVAGNWMWAGNTGVSGFTPLSPTGTNMYLLMMKEADGSFYSFTGSVFSSSVSGTRDIISNIPQYPTSSGDLPLAAIRATGGKARISWSDVFDVRQLYGGTGEAQFSGTIAISRGGTGEVTAQAAINSLANVAGANEGDLLTVVSGNVQFAAPGLISGTYSYPKYATMWHDQSIATVGNAIESNHDANQNYTFLARQNTPAINDACTNGFVLAAGTYTLNILCATYTDKGIATFYIDNVSIGTVDLYSASLTYNVKKTISNISITTGYHTLKIVAASKNASSSNYQIAITKMFFTPSAY